MIQLIQLMLLLYLIGFAVASLASCFLHFMQPEMIFEWYGSILRRLNNKSKFWSYITKPYYPTIDRIDNNKGYHNDNVIACTLEVNNMKGDISIELIKQLAALIKKKGL